MTTLPRIDIADLRRRCPELVPHGALYNIARDDGNAAAVARHAERLRPYFVKLEV